MQLDKILETIGIVVGSYFPILADNFETSTVSREFFPEELELETHSESNLMFSPEEKSNSRTVFEMFSSTL